MQLQTELDEITGHWQTKIDHALEAGRDPLLFVGQSSTTLDMLTGLLAFEQLANRRTDVSTPSVAFGGPSPLWMGALAAMGQARDNHPLRPAYLGEDQATILAAGNLAAAQYGPTARRQARLPGNVPPGFAALVLPATRPAAPIKWEGLPFSRIRSVETDGRVDGAAPAALFLAVLLILFALFL